jgi:hypothetical protein
MTAQHAGYYHTCIIKMVQLQQLQADLLSSSCSRAQEAAGHSLRQALADKFQ